MIRSPQRRAFTLLELVLVLALVALIMAAAVPSIQSMFDDMKLQAAADHLRSRFAEARSRAIEDGRAYRFAVIPNQSDYRLAPDSPDYWGSGDPQSTDGSTGNPPLVAQDQLPNGILFQHADGQSGRSGDSGPWTSLVTFLPDGSCDNDCSIVLEFQDARPVQISLRALTGSVTTQSNNQGGSPSGNQGGNP